MFLLSFAAIADYKLFFKSQKIEIPPKSEETLPEEKFSYLRIQILDNNGNTYVALGDLNWVINGADVPNKALGQYSDSPYLVSDSGFVGNDSDVYGGWKLYDDNGSGQFNRWLGYRSDMPYHIDLYVGEELNYYDLEKIELTPASYTNDGTGARSVRHFKVFISKDGVNWTEKMDVSGIESTEWSAGIENSYLFQN